MEPNLDREKPGAISQAASLSRRAKLVGMVALVLTIGFIGAIAGAGAAYLALRPHVDSTVPSTESTALVEPLNFEISTQITDVVQQVGPSVVTVVSQIGGQPIGSGSGVIISEQGHIVTNHHVIENAQSLTVMLADGTELAAELIGTDPFSDLAVVRVDDQELPAPAPWGNSDELAAGETVIAIGSPLGDFVNTVTAGVVSNASRSIEVAEGFLLQELIQTDAAINQGNSGGPLLNLAGQVVGINSLVVRGGGSGAVAEGLGFAIPSNTARAITDQLIRRGAVARPHLGIRWRWITPQISERFNLPVAYGVLITDVIPGSPAEDAGLRRGDILVSLNGQEFDADHPFINVLYSFKPGETVHLEFLRANQPRQEIQLTLQSRPSP